MSLSLPFSRDKCVAVVDVSSGSAGIAVLQLNGDKPCTVLAVARSAPAYDARSSGQSLSMISTEIAEAAEQLAKNSSPEARRAAIETVYVIVHAPWISTETVTDSARFPEDRYIRDSAIAAMAKDMVAEHVKGLKDPVIAAGVVRVSLNGYATKNPGGKYAHEVDLSVAVATCAPEVKDVIRSAVEKVFPAADIVWRSSQRSMLTVLRDMREHFVDCVVVEMGSDVTDIIAVHNGVITAHRNVPEGTQTVLSRIAGKEPVESTLSLVRMLGRDACEGDACEAVQKAMAIAEPDLARVFGEAIGTLAAERRLGNDLILIAHPDLVDWFTTFFERIDFTQFTVTTMPFAVFAPSFTDFTPWMNTDAEIDSMLALESALVNIESRE